MVNCNDFSLGCEYLKKILKIHIDGKKDYTRELRAIVNLEIWFRQFIDE